jgi:hypothetical protein
LAWKLNVAVAPELAAEEYMPAVSVSDPVRSWGLWVLRAFEALERSRGLRHRPVVR